MLQYYNYCFSCSNFSCEDTSGINITQAVSGFRLHVAISEYDHAVGCHILQVILPRKMVQLTSVPSNKSVGSHVVESK